MNSWVLWNIAACYGERLRNVFFNWFAVLLVLGLLGASQHDWLQATLQSWCWCWRQHTMLVDWWLFADGGIYDVICCWFIIGLFISLEIHFFKCFTSSIWHDFYSPYDFDCILVFLSCIGYTAIRCFKTMFLLISSADRKTSSDIMLMKWVYSGILLSFCNHELEQMPTYCIACWLIFATPKL